MKRFLNGEGVDWADSLRDAEQFLPGDSPFREPLTRVRERIEDYQREGRFGDRAPIYDLYLENVAEPLVETAQRLENEIQRMLKQKEFALTDEGSVPQQYQHRVSEYFKALSESETIEP